ncbi:MAG: LLM class flavin-dependent oxidoreductase, partial [Actinomycetota bacterium]
MRGFTLRDPLPWPAFAGLARQGEALGYDAVFLPEVGGRDTLAALVGLAGETTGLRLGTGIVPMTARPTVLTAMAAATVQERSGGRLLLGLGTGAPAPGSLERLRAEVGALRALLAGEAAEIDGARQRLALVPTSPPPIWIAALGPRSTRLAGEIADGALLNWCTPERVVRARREIREGAEVAGRDPASVTVGVYVRACVEQDATAASAALAVAAAAYAAFPAYARQFAAMGLGDRSPAELAGAVCLAGGAGATHKDPNHLSKAGAAPPLVSPIPTEP